jgi:hypothetical protein
MNEDRPMVWFNLMMSSPWCEEFLNAGSDQESLCILGVGFDFGKTELCSLLVFELGNLVQAAVCFEKVNLRDKGWRRVPRPDSDIFDGCHQFRNPDVLGASFVTCIARRTKPDEITGKDLVPHAKEGHSNDFPGVVAVRYLSNRTTGCAGSTGKAPLDMFTARFSGNLVLELVIEVTDFDHGDPSSLDMGLTKPKFPWSLVLETEE